MSQKQEKLRRRVDRLADIIRCGEHSRKTRQERRREQEARFNIMLCGVAIILSLCVLATLTTPTAAAETTVDNGRLLGDDTEAIEPIIIEYPEEEENRLIEEALLSKAAKLENVRITHYCVEKYPHICGTGDGITASGRKVTPGVSVAVDTSVIPLGADVLIDYGDGELHYMRADDTGSAIKGKRLDVCVESHSEALSEGVKTATVWWVCNE